MMKEPHLWAPQQWEREMLAMQPTEAQRAVVFTAPLTLNTPLTGPKAKFATLLSKKWRTTRIVVVILILIAAIVTYFTWFSSPQNTSTGTSLQTTTAQNFSATPVISKTTSTDTTATSSGGGSIQVYIVGAVKRPGIYTLDANARVYQVLKDAGGPLSEANLVAINLAAPIKDGEEIYIPKVGESVPANLDGSNSSTGTTGSTLSSGSTGALVNINAASETEMRQQLHVSAKTAQAIISYRLQHGNYTSVDQLANAVSKAIYNRIKGMVTV